MELSVVVSTLNNREQLLSSLDALDDQLPSETELIVVNGPSSDGTTGVVRDRDDVDVLVEISERNPNVSRNAGFEIATGEVVAFLGSEYVVETGWYDALSAALDAGTDVVTGPLSGPDGASDDESPSTAGGRGIASIEGDNAAFDRTVLEALDGFDEYLTLDGASDCAHRVAGLGFDVTWSPEMGARSDVGADGGRADPDWGGVYRSLAYCQTKNHGPRPTVLARTVGSAIRDGVAGVRGLLAGEETPTGWFADGTAVVANAAAGFRDGLRARYADRSARRNPNGVSTRHDRAVRIYDRR